MMAWKCDCDVFVGTLKPHETKLEFSFVVFFFQHELGIIFLSAFFVGSSFVMRRRLVFCDVFRRNCEENLRIGKELCRKSIRIIFYSVEKGKGHIKFVWATSCVKIELLIQNFKLTYGEIIMSENN